ncbi:hypothetical protein GCM10027405_19370 [Arthrobacter alkaliphilus]|jgi:hypothetical protein|uniref:hypothetical protein n=1 Tax=Arthrobacter alkaliphilus TaxID=369936 RepID=UPI001F1AFC0D|nr:hypothetical protein [Arthrobacter alkaliphilus]
MTDFPKYPLGNETASLNTGDGELAGGRSADLAVYAAGSWVAGFVTYLVACLVGLSVSKAARGGDTAAAWAALAYPIESVWMWGPMILLALILAIVAKARKGPRRALSTTIVTLSATFPVLAVLVLVVEFTIAQAVATR